MAKFSVRNVSTSTVPASDVDIWEVITDPERLRENYAQNCLPASLLDGDVPDYDDFLAERRQLVALRIKEWFEVLS